MKFAVTFNALVLASIVGIGAFKIEDSIAQEFVNSVSKEDRYCLQQNIFFESRNQSTLGQVAVAWVTLNRVESTRYPDSICKVVWQQSAFSWTHDGKSDTPSDNPLEQKAWKKAGTVAEVVLLDWTRDSNSPVENATMFHADYVNPYWSTSYDRVTQIDSHVFYK